MTVPRRLLLGFLTLLLIASIMMPMAQAQSDSPDITVSPGESIQSAVNAANPGDTIQLEQGTYEQGVIINKSLTITASGDVTLDGDAIDAQDGIVVDAADVTIEGVEIARFSDDGIRVRGDILDQRQIEIVDVTARLNGGSNIFVASGTERDSILLSGVVSSNNEFGPGLDINAENVTIEDATVQEADRSGIDVTAESEGTVTIERTVVSGGGGDDGFDENDDGITVRSAKELTISDTEVTNSQDLGITLFDTDAVAGGRTVRFTNVTSRANENNDIFIGGTNDRDSVLMRGVVSGSNEFGPSIDVDVENVTIENATVQGADRSGIDVTAGSEGTVTIERTVVSGGGGDDGFDENDDGIIIRSAKKLTINDTELTNTQDIGVSVLENSVAAGGRTIVFNNGTSEGNGDGGFLIDGTTDADSVSIVNSTIQNNGNDGIEIAIETATVSQTRISNNTDAGIRFEGAFTGGTVDRSSILNNQGPEIINSIDDATVDARNNWWGVPTGPSETEITGEVRVENPLNAPPGTISPLSLAGTVQQSGAPGETARVSYTISNVSDQSSVAINITELPDPVSVNPSASATNGGTFGSSAQQVLFSQPAGEQTLTIAYDIDASANATFNVTAEVLDQDSATTDTATVEVGATETGPVARFDADGDGEISLSEVQTAIRAFSNGELDLQGVQQVIAAFSG